MLKEQQRQRLYTLLGDVPSALSPVHAHVISREEHEHFIIEKLVLDLNGIEPVPAYFIVPKSTGEKSPVILFNHSHGGRYHAGKEEVLAGAPYLYEKSYAEELTACGYSILCIDEWGFGERSTKTESALFKEMLWRGQVMWGMMVYDSIRALDYLCAREDVDNNRIGTLGMSMGSTKAWWLAALDTRINVCADICCMTDFQTLIESNGVDQHGVYYYVPGLINYFSTAGINALISPRPHISVNGIYDHLTPEKGLDIVYEEVKKVYEEEGAAEQFQLKKYPVAHLETAEMRKDIVSFLKKWL